MTIGQAQLMKLKFGGRDRRENKADGREWKIVEFAYNLWLVAVIAICLMIVICC